MQGLPVLLLWFAPGGVAHGPCATGASPRRMQM